MTFLSKIKSGSPFWRSTLCFQKGDMMDLTNIDEILKKACDELSLTLVSTRFYKDPEMGDMLEVLIDKDYNITMDEIEAFTEKVNPLLDALPELDIPYTLDISSGGSEREIPFEDLGKLLDHYLDIKLKKSGETITIKPLSFEEGVLKGQYFIKGRKKSVELTKEDIESIHMGYKA